MARKKRRKKRTQSNRASFKSEPSVLYEYYTLTFGRLHGELSFIYGDVVSSSAVREQFWRLILPGVYTTKDAQVFLTSYAKSVEANLAERLQKQSIAYWYHVYRRLGPGAIGEDKSPATILYTRAVLDAAIQKYGAIKMCNRIAFSSMVDFKRIFAGEPTGREAEVISTVISHQPQIVLTDFTVHQLAEFYICENLAYEIWRASALLRSTGKGCGLEVMRGDPWYTDIRSEEQKVLISSYDDRSEFTDVFGTQESHSGTVFSNHTSRGMIPLYVQNVTKSDFSFANIWLKHTCRINAKTSHPSGKKGFYNFLIFPMNLGAYLEAHRPLAKAFMAKYGLELEECLAVICALGLLPLIIATSIDPLRIIHAEKRGYDGSFSLSRIEKWVASCLAECCQRIGCKSEMQEHRIRPVLEWLSLPITQRENIDLIYPGPHSVFLPLEGSEVGENEGLVDYAWMYRRLRDLFFGVSIDDNNFKGDALEKLVRTGASPLPHKELRAFDNSAKQVDASFEIGKRLLIVECRAWPRSIGFERGQPQAVEKVHKHIDKILKDVDGKAQWLARNPVGHNYDVSRFREIIGVGVSPFVEYIPSLFEWYWLRPGVPRLLTPDELKTELTELKDGVDCFHGFPVQ